ncbi:MAG: NUDIX hydrolase [Candidatus Paceibacterota bacterium]
MSPGLYYSRPRKLVGVSVIFRNGKGDFLIAKPTYREDWLFIGGIVDEEESPFAAALREVKEEIGLEFSSLPLLSICHASGDELVPDHLKFSFDGGVLTDEQINSIVLQESELSEYKFLPLEKLEGLVTQRSFEVAQLALKSQETGKAYFLDSSGVVEI